jgi:uncharacterized protein
MTRPVYFTAPVESVLDRSFVPRDWIVEGNPQVRSQRLMRTADGTTSLFVWTCTTGRFNWYYRVDETLHIISGEVFITDASGETRRLGPGDVAFFPAGSQCLWHVTQDVKKLAVCRHSMPRPFGVAVRAWNKLLHYLAGGLSGGGGLGAAVIDKPAAHS